LFCFLRKKIFTKLIDLCFDEVVLFEPNENYNQQIKRKKTLIVFPSSN